MKQIESDGENANGQAGAEPSTSALESGALTVPHKQGATGPCGMCLFQRGLFARSTRIMFRGFRNLVGRPPPKQSLQREEEKGKKRGGKIRKKKTQVRMRCPLTTYKGPVRMDGGTGYLCNLKVRTHKLLIDY